MSPHGLRHRLDPETRPTAPSFERTLSSIFDDFLHRREPNAVSLMNKGSWLPSLDVTENQEVVSVTAELPGLSGDDVSITFADGTLTLEGEKKSEYEDNKDGMHHIERSFGKFVRRIHIPADIESNKIEAEFKDGVLRVELPKSQEARVEVRSIPVKQG